ncbi:MAG TPA: 4-alpha-glucanotransferase [Thermoanaerobaculia bacterium]|nr:4-alpha-glucanotransferase [Thermoanaerobaculia bacterium]
MRTPALRDLARLYSIETTYTDAAGTKQHASREALVAAIEKRAGASIDDVAKLRRESPLVEAVVVLWGNDRTIDVELPDNTVVEWDIALEDGSWRSGRIDVLGGTITLDQPLPPGYHTLTIDGNHEAFVIASPLKAAPPRDKTWGVFAPLYAAHTRRSWGAGDLGDLMEYASWIDHHGGGVVATLPMLAAFDDEPSPYSPVSRLFWNEMYLDVTRLPEFDPNDADAGAIVHLQQLREVDYAAVRREKRRVLMRCAERFAGDAVFAQFASHANDYARFRAGGDAAETRYHLYVQYRMAQQMREVANAARRLGAGLYLDFPLGVNPGGYDAQRYAHVFARGVSVGAPPDLFFTKGQNWGFAPFDPDAIRHDRYEYYRAAVRHHVSHAGILRIDHVMGLHRLYWVPEGHGAKDGVYVRYRADELYAILVLESRRHGCVIVGEDLGTVPPEVPKKMNRHGLRRMYVVQYEAQPASPPLQPPPAASVASINTHDMPTFAAWWTAKDVDDRVAMGLLDEVGAQRERDTRERMKQGIVQSLVDGPSQNPQKTLEAVLSYLAASDAEIVLLNLEDLWGELEPQNVPGVPEHSWRHKFRMSLEDARADGSIRRVLVKVNGLRAGELLQSSGPEIVSKEG